MARREAIKRLAKTLRARRAEQHKRLAAELTSLHDIHASDAIGDSADGAFENSSDELSSQLAQLDARELGRIEQALARLEKGTYGICEGDSPKCQKEIPLTRLNALPDSRLCIHCQRERDEHPDGVDGRGEDSWNRIVDTLDPIQDHQAKLADLESDLAGGCRG